MALLLPAISHSKDLKAYGKDCEKIGFKPKTPAYGKCILELSREDINSAPQQKEERVSNVRVEDYANLPAGYVKTKTLGTTGSVIDNHDATSKLDGNGTLIWSRNNMTFGSSDRNSPRYIDIFTTCYAMNSSRTLGYSSGWRLPTQQELSGLYNTNISALPGQDWTLNFTWSSSDNGAGVYRGVYLFNGDVSPFISSIFGYVTCVHENP